MIKARKLGHVVLSVTDLDASKAFYTKALGLEIVAENSEQRIVFLSLGEQHHDLALIQRATGARPDSSQPGLVHFAWQMADFPALQDAYNELTDAGFELDPIQHNITNSLYLEDPDGHLVELYCDRWENGIEVMRTQGPKRVMLDMETGEAAGGDQELLPVRSG